MKGARRYYNQHSFAGHPSALKVFEISLCCSDGCAADPRDPIRKAEEFLGYVTDLVFDPDNADLPLLVECPHPKHVSRGDDGDRIVLNASALDALGSLYRFPFVLWYPCGGLQESVLQSDSLELIDIAHTDPSEFHDSGLLMLALAHRSLRDAMFIPRSDLDLNPAFGVDPWQYALLRVHELVKEASQKLSDRMFEAVDALSHTGLLVRNAAIAGALLRSQYLLDRFSPHVPQGGSSDQFRETHDLLSKLLMTCPTADTGPDKPEEAEGGPDEPEP